MKEFDLKHLRYFVEVASTLNITKAAENLNVVKSVLSKSVTQLEKQMGTRLLDRTTRRVQLTESGEYLYQRAQYLLQEAKHLAEDMESLNSQVSGVLRLTATPAFGRYLSSTLIPIFTTQWPNVSVRLELSYDYENLFSSGLDLAFRFTDIKDDRLITREIGQSKRILVASNQYLSQADLIKRVEDLEHHNCLLFQTREAHSTWDLTDDKVRTAIEVSGQFQCSNIDVLREAALNGMGVACLPIFIVRDDIKAKRLIQVLPQWYRPNPLYLAYRTGSHHSPKLAAFLQCVQDNAHFFDIH